MKNRNIYIDALTQLGYDLSGKESYKKLKSIWQDYRKDYKSKYGENAPSVYQTAGIARNYDVPTLDFGSDYIFNFLRHVEQVYTDTITYIDGNKEGKHEEGKLASIASFRLDELSDRYFEIVRTVREMVQEFGTEVVAQAIADNVELDYTIAVSLLPPSDIYFEFDETISQLLAITNQLNRRAEELAEEMESEYYGE